MEKTKKEEPQAAKEKKSIKYAKGDFQLEKKAQGVVLPVSYLLLFLFLLCVFYLILFFVLLCCDLPAGKKLFKNVDIFRSFSPSVSLPLCRSTSHRRTARVVPPTLLSLSHFLFLSVTLHYTDIHLHSRTRLLRVWSFCVVCFCFVFAPQQTVFFLRVFVCSLFRLVFVFRVSF